MGAQVHEVLDGLGTWQLDLKRWDAELAAELLKNRIVVISEGETPRFPLVILSDSPTETHPSVGGQFADWRLGAGDTGPLIESREYVSGADKLANGDFDLGDLYYRFGQDTHWAIADTGPAAVGADSNTDDILESDEVFPAAPGNQYRLTLVSRRPSGTVGRLRGRIVYEGRFSPPNLVANGDLEEGAATAWATATYLTIIDDPDDAHAGNWVMRVFPIPQPDALVNGDFESGASTGWTVVGNSYLAPVSEIINDPSRSRSGDWVLLMGTTQRRAVANGDFETGDFTGWTLSPGSTGWTVNNVDRSGNYAAQLDGSLSPGPNALAAIVPSEQPHVGAGSPSHHIATATGERWQFLGYAMRDPGTSPPNGAEVWAELQFFPDDVTVTNFTAIQSRHVTSLDPVGSWRAMLLDVKTPSGDFTNMTVTLQVQASTSGIWHFDDIECVRIEGNEEILSSDPMTVAPSEEWMLTVYARSGDAFRSGGLFPRVRLRGVKNVTTKALTSNVATLTIGTHSYVVGQKVQVEDVDATFDGTYVLTAVTSTTISYALTHANIGATGATGTAGNPDILNELPPISQTNGKWLATSKTVSIPDGYDTAIVELRGRDIEGEWIYVDDVSFVRTVGNTDSITHDPITLIPGRSYQLKAQIRSGPNATGPGTVNLVGTYSAPGRDDITFEASQDPTDGAWQELALGIAPPSGYDSFTLAVKAQDTLGDSWWVDDITLLDRTDPVSATDLHTKTFVEDVVIDTTGAGTHTLDSTAPGGTQKVHVQLVAESKGAGWAVDEWHLQRTGVTPATVGQIVADLLTNPDTDVALLTPGTIHNAGTVISHDWLIENLHNLEALVHLLQGGVAPTLQEYRVNPDLTVDVGTADELYQVAVDERDHPIVLTEEDVDVVKRPEVTVDLTTYASHIKVVGAQRQTANGDPVTITALAEVPWDSPLLEDDGSPLHRVKVVTDSSVNHPLYAQALAQFLATDMAAAQQAVTLGVGDLRARGRVDVGDWLNIYAPDAGLEDPSRERTDRDGDVVAPKKIRVIERTLKLGSGAWKAEVIRPGEDPFDITDAVLWDTETSAEIVVGAKRPEFTSDDEGGAVFTQFRRFVASAAH